MRKRHQRHQIKAQDLEMEIRKVLAQSTHKRLEVVTNLQTLKSHYEIVYSGSGGTYIYDLNRAVELYNDL